MIFFPREDDTKDLKALIKANVFNYAGKKDKLRKGVIKEKGKLAGKNYSYDYNFDYEFITFDEHHIYVHDEEVPLTQLLLGKVIFAEDVNDVIEDILSKRNLKLEPISIGYTEAKFYEGESFASEDVRLSAYEIVENS